MTSGVTGIAAFDCNATASTNTYVSDSTTAYLSFMQECYTDYLNGEHLWNSSTPTIGDITKLTVYNFQSCMDQCAIYNGQQSSGDAKICQAVTYNASLTMTRPWNCWLNTGRGKRFDDDPSAEYASIASAYVTGYL